MAEPVTDRGGKLYTYELEPANLAVHASDSPDGGVTLVWAGHSDIRSLADFFEQAASTVGVGRNAYYRASFVTQAGQREIPYVQGKFSAPIDLVKAATFVEFECSAAPPQSSGEREDPLLAVYANLDSRGGTSLENAPESTGVYIRHPEALQKLSSAIAETMSSTTVPFAPVGYSYSRAYQRLQEAQADLALRPR